MMYSAYKLNKQGDNIQPWRTAFPIWNQSVVPCPVLTVASWPAYRFLKRHVRWSGILISFRIFHSLLWSTQSKALACQQSRNRCLVYCKSTLTLLQTSAVKFWLSAQRAHELWLGNTTIGWILQLQHSAAKIWWILRPLSFSQSPQPSGSCFCTHCPYYHHIRSKRSLSIFLTDTCICTRVQTYAHSFHHASGGTYDGN